MTTNNSSNISNKINKSEKILLALMPFWPPVLPPQGISSIKAYLQQQGYRVKIVDSNLIPEFRGIFAGYFEMLKQYIPAEKRGNIYNIGNDIFQNHLMAYLNYQDEKQYRDLLKMLVMKTFFCNISDSHIIELHRLIAGFYHDFETYFLQLLAEEKPGILGISVYNLTAPASLFSFKLTKEKFPHIKTIMGGGIFTGELVIDSPNFDYFLERTPYIDKIFVGESELLLLKYLRGELPEAQRVYTLADINFETVNLNTLPPLDYSDFDIQYYPYQGAYTSRGCPFHCAFCTEKVFWSKYREKNAGQVAAQMVEQYKMHNTQLFFMCDSLLNPVITKLAREIIKSGVSIYWDGYLKADSAAGDISNTLLWRKGGFYKARLGLESGSQRMLEAMGKGITPQQIKKAVSSLAYAGIKTCTLWLLGFPGETEDDFRQTLQLVEELKDDIYEVHCNPFFYFFKGQVNSSEWLKKNQHVPLYPPETKELLIYQYWMLQTEPSRQEIYSRINRFVQHCHQLEIPTTYQVKDFYNADERWKKLQINAVPSISEFSKGTYLDENKEDKNLFLANQTPETLDQISFGF